MDVEYGAYSIIGKNHHINEDRYRLLGNEVPLVKQVDKGQMFAVFDGMGSVPKGGEAAQFMCDRLVAFYKEKGGDYAQDIYNLLVTGNKDICKWGFCEEYQRQRPKGACVGTVSWLHKERLNVFHAGDTIAMLIRNGVSSVLTIEHGDGKGGVGNYFGRGVMRLDVDGFQIQEGDLIVLASDGVTKGCSNHVIAETVDRWSLDSAERAARELCLLAKRCGSQDDITAVVVEIIEM